MHRPAWLRKPLCRRGVRAPRRHRSRSGPASGRPGWPTLRVNWSSAASPPVSAAAATAGRSPPSIAARRTTGAAMSAAFATASAITPTRAPCRSSPPSRRRRKVCSVSVAAANSPLTSSARRACDPFPATWPISLNAASTLQHGQRRLVRRGRQRAQRRPADPDLALRQLPGQPGHHDGDQLRVVLGACAAQQVGDAGDLGQPRRSRADLGRRGGDVNELHEPSLARPSDISEKVAEHRRGVAALACGQQCVAHSLTPPLRWLSSHVRRA